MTLDAKILSFEEVSKHNRKTDCWLLITGKVYDVTAFLDDHPGGDEVLTLATEKDATEDFEDVGHSQNAIDMMKDYYVGDIDVNSMPQKTRYGQPSTTSSASSQASTPSTNILTFVLPLIIFLLAYALYYFGKKEVVISYV